MPIRGGRSGSRGGERERASPGVHRRDRPRPRGRRRVHDLDQHDRGLDAALPRLHDRGSRRARELRRGRLPALVRLAADPRASSRSSRPTLHRSMALPPEAFGWFHGLPTHVHPMDFLHAVVAGLSLHDPDANLIERRRERCASRCGSPRGVGTIVAAYQRVRSGQWPLQPMPDKSIAWNFLYMLHGRGARRAGGPALRHLPDPARGPRAERLGVLGARHLEHALRASTRA